MEGFRQGLLDNGIVEGRDAVIIWQSANGDLKLLPRLVRDLVQRKVDVIVVGSTNAAQEVKHATSAIPIVIALIADPVESGLVANLTHPGGNITGLSTMSPDLTAKRLQLLKEMVPGLTRLAVLWNPDTPFQMRRLDDLKAAALLLSIHVKLVGARTPEEFGAAFSAIQRAQAQAMYVFESAMFYSQRLTLAKLALQSRLPTIYGTKAYADEGGLMSYGVNYADQLHQSAGYVDKILKGAKPGDLPVELPTKFELVVNLKTAKLLRMTVPESILLRADEVIH